MNKAVPMPWRWALTALVALTIGVMMTVGIFAYRLSRTQEFQSVQQQRALISQCAEEGMKPIFDAIQRYRVRHDDYPKALDDLVPDFLQESAIKKCPLDQGSARFSYRYRPGTILLQCERHAVGNRKVLVSMDADGKVRRGGKDGK